METVDSSIILLSCQTNHSPFSLLLPSSPLSLIHYWIVSLSCFHFLFFCALLCPLPILESKDNSSSKGAEFSAVTYLKVWRGNLIQLNTTFRFVFQDTERTFITLAQKVAKCFIMESWKCLIILSSFANRGFLCPLFPHDSILFFSLILMMFTIILPIIIIIIVVRSSSVCISVVMVFV